ncbi:Exoglucanase 1 [Pleurotus pulmonarius]|nr:Exoglucanase 1 [Pleurotus pulmonarius]KAF4600641.1 Exoglucanase 1 [Pleurotus pulmonarius]KAF4602462.1 Exoglucanase 1 [Pleurotus pulmonarius]
MFNKIALTALAFGAMAFGQQIGTLTTETHPPLTIQQCTASGCSSLSRAVTLDSNWRWLHSTSSATNCYTGNTFDATLCPPNDGAACAANCALDGADYSGTYGITTSGNALTLKFVTTGANKNIGSRVYLMEDNTHYKTFNLKNQEFTFDVDMSNLPCGLNGALYFSEMPADGGVSSTNAAGARFGTGYCDSQCPHDLKFIGGVANNVGWTGSSSDPNSGAGNFGACCGEMDIWEANSMAAAFTPHPCSTDGLFRCTGTDCGDGDNRYAGVCDKDGCDFNSYRMGDRSFLGLGKTVDTSKKITVVTQFITDDNTSSGDLVEIRRVYVQDGVVIQNSVTSVPGLDPYDSITGDFCAAQKSAFGDTNYFATKGGLTQMGKSFDNGMVLVLSVWDDHAVNMLWLDSDFPTDKDPSLPGVSRGACATSSGVPAEVEAQFPNASVTYSNIKYGPIGSTFGGSTPPTSSTPVTSSTPSTTSSGTTPTAPSGTVPQWAQCGGINYTGPTVCVAPFTCHVINDFYSQCF